VDAARRGDVGRPSTIARARDGDGTPPGRAAADSSSPGQRSSPPSDVGERSIGLVPVTDDVRRTGGGGLDRAAVEDVEHCSDVRRTTAAAAAAAGTVLLGDVLTSPASSSSSSSSTPS